MNCIPAELRALRRWVCWRYEDTGKAKPAKVPCTTGGYHTSAARKRHATFADVVDAAARRSDYFSGIGFVFAAGDGYTGVDFDNCLDERGAFCNPWAETWVRRLHSYSEISPSGRGVKVIVRGRVPRALKQAQIEIYDRARYFTITARLLPGAPATIRDAQAELDELFSALRPAATDVDTTSPAAIADDEVRAELDTFAGLLDDEQAPRCLTGRSQGRAVLRAALAGWPDGAPDYSLERYKLMASLAMHGYGDAQIAAALWYYRPVLNGGGKTIANWGADIARVIGKVRAAHPDWLPTPKGRRVNVATRPPHAPEPPVSTSRARKDRPQKVPGALGYLAWLRMQADGAGVMLSAHECAQRLGCSLATIRRYERELRAAGLIERRVFAQRQAGCLFLLEADPRSVNIPAHEPAQAEADPPQPDALNDVDTTVQAVERHTCFLPPGPAPSLPAAVAEALDALDQQLVNPETGELLRRCPASRVKIRAWLTERWPDLEIGELPAVLSAVRAERAAERAKVRSRDEWAGHRLQAQHLTDVQLLAAVRGHASRMAAATNKRPGSGYAKGCAVRFTIYDEERRRRGLSLADAPPPKRGRAERRAGAKRVVELAQVLSKPPREGPAFGQKAMLLLTFEPPTEQAGVCPSPAAQPPASDPLAEAAVGIAGRLRNLPKAVQQQGVAQQWG
jgi:hypothetical protein